jgi:hypothetical protein
MISAVLSAPGTELYPGRSGSTVEREYEKAWHWQPDWSVISTLAPKWWHEKGMNLFISQYEQIIFQACPPNTPELHANDP